MIYLILLGLSVIVILAIVLSLVLSFRVAEIREDLESIKRHERRHSTLQIRLLQKLLDILERTHPDIFNEISEDLDEIGEDLDK